MTEAELAQKFVTYLSDYDLYFEAPPHMVDIVAISGIKRMAFEVKKSLNFKVIEQAFRNKQWFHLSFIAIPKTKGNSFAYHICKDYGIGVLEYDEYTNIAGWDIRETVKPKFNKIPKKLLDACKYEDYMKQSVPGSSGYEGNVVTAFKMTVLEIERYVKRNPGCTLKEVINGIEHHYSNFTSARGSIYQYLRNGVISTIRLENGKLYLNI